MIAAKIVTANGTRVRMTLRHSSTTRALYHIGQVYPGNLSVQITVLREVSPC